MLYDSNCNAILVAPLKTRQAHKITQQWKQLHAKLTKHCHVTTNYIMDNEFSADPKATLTKATLQYELASQNIQRHNAAKRAIRTFKNHFLEGIATCSPTFPITKWDQFLTHAQVTLNLLHFPHQSKIIHLIT